MIFGGGRHLNLLFFSRFFGAAKRVYKVLLIATEPSVHKKFVKKVTEKVLTRYVRCGIIYKSTRYGTETKAKVARHLKFVPSKLNIEPIKKRMCGSSVL